MDPSNNSSSNNNNSYSNTSAACAVTTVAVDDEKVTSIIGSGNSTTTTTSTTTSNKEEASSSKLTQQFVDWVDKQNPSSSPSSSSSSVNSELLDGVSLNSEELQAANKLLICNNTNNHNHTITNSNKDEASSLEYSLILVPPNLQQSEPQKHTSIATTSSSTSTRNNDEIRVDSFIDVDTSILLPTHNTNCNPTIDEDNQTSINEASMRMTTQPPPLKEHDNDEEEEEDYFSCKDFSPLHPEEALLDTKHPTTAAARTNNISFQKNSKPQQDDDECFHTTSLDSSWQEENVKDDFSPDEEESLGGKGDEDPPKITTRNTNGTSIAKTTTTTTRNKKKKAIDIPRNTNNRKSHTTTTTTSNASSAAVLVLEPKDYNRTSSSSSSRISFGDTTTTVVASRAKLVLPTTRSTDVPNRDQWTYITSRQRIPYSQNLHPPLVIKTELVPQKRPRVQMTSSNDYSTCCLYNRKTCQQIVIPTNTSRKSQQEVIGELLAGYAELEPCLGEQQTVGRTSSNVNVVSTIRPQNSIWRCSDAHVGCFVEVTCDGSHHQGKQGIIQTALPHIGWYIISLLSSSNTTNKDTEDIIYIKATHLKCVHNTNTTMGDDFNIQSLRGMDPSVLSQF